MRNVLPIAIGLSATLIVHAALAYALNTQDWGSDDVGSEIYKSEEAVAERVLTLCNERYRCPWNERRQRRRGPEAPPVEDLEVLEAAIVPKLGLAEPEPDTKKLPELIDYEEAEIVEHAINIDNEFTKPKKIETADEAREEKRDPLSKKSDLDEIIKGYQNDDPRLRRKDLSKIIGDPDGDIHGAGLDKRLGNAYSAKAARAIKSVFKTPPFIDEASLARLKVRVIVSRIGFDGAIQSYRVVSWSGNKSFDDAALAAVKGFAPGDGGSRKLPTPPNEVLRYINTKGLTITLDGSQR